MRENGERIRRENTEREKKGIEKGDSKKMDRKERR